MAHSPSWDQLERDLKQQENSTEDNITAIVNDNNDNNCFYFAYKAKREILLYVGIWDTNPVLGTQ